MAMGKPDAVAYLHPMTRPATDIAAFHRMVETALDSLPAVFAPAARQVVISVIDLPPAEVLADFGIEDPLELTGLYDGVPLTEKSVGEQAIGPDVIWLYRLPILEEWRERGDIGLDDLVTHVLVHELAHHFGWSDDDIASIDRWWE
jgi:predicted Zn-dependent protease with MMP-like domain